MANGKDCKCGAYSFAECSCIDVDWRSEREATLEHERVLLIEAILHMQYHLERIAHRGNTLLQKRDIARKGLILSDEVASIINEHKEKSND